MSLLSPLFSLCCFLILLLLNGCAAYDSAYQASGTPTHTDPYAHSGIEEVLAFGVSMANMPEDSRAELCKSLLHTQQISPSDGVQLHLMVGRLLSDACGDIPRLLDGINAIHPAYVADPNLQRLITLHKQVLARMQNQSKKLGTSERKQQRVKSTQEAKDTQEPKKDETRLLREKLEAIRSMEKQMDESSGGN